LHDIGVKIAEIQPDSPAHRAGLQAGDRLLELDGRTLEDVLDLRFYLEAREVALKVQRCETKFEVTLDLAEEADPGWEVEPLQVRSCHCDCKFCFVQQLPAGLRSSLYIKDEDYRFSFLFGSYLTLVGFTAHDLERVLRLRLSPLYISIHATDPFVRGRLLGLKRAPILPQLEKLITGGIELHGQIVLVPDHNDGEILQRSLEDLRELYPGLASLSVVPVGLTGHRLYLEPLRLLDCRDSLAALTQIWEVQDRMMTSTGCRWVYPADELLLTAGQPIPPESDYDDYPQLDNGVGLIRWTIMQAEEALSDLPATFPQSRRLLWVTGQSAYPILMDLAARFTSQIAGLHIEVLAVTNHLLGESVTVAGLLGGKDMTEEIIEYMRTMPAGEVVEVYLPPSCLNPDGLLLDDWTPARMSTEIGLSVAAFDGNWWAMITGEEVGESS
jgi:putative radical SAM enzyme (TIGR03279 family)